MVHTSQMVQSLGLRGQFVVALHLRLLTDDASAALDRAQRELNQYVAFLVGRGAKNIRLNSDDLTLNLPD